VRKRRSPALPNLALRAERAPNAKGAEQLGYTRDYAQGSRQRIGRRRLVLDEPDARRNEWCADLRRLRAHEDARAGVPR